MPRNFPVQPNLCPTRFGGPEINSLTAIRGIAAWWVVFYHFDSYLRPYVPSPLYYLISKGHLAVDLFFCLSGFVIFLNYGSLNLQSKREIFRFYLRRLAKIYPLHIFVLFLYGLLLLVLILTHRDPSSRFSGSSLLLNLFLMQDWAVLHELTWNIPSWSISAEFAAYLLFPAVVLLVRSVTARFWHQLLAIAATLCVLNIFYAPLGFEIGSAIERIGVVRSATQFTIGAIVAHIFLATPSARRSSQIGLYISSAMLLVVGLYTLETVMVPLAWAALVLATARGNYGWLNHQWLVFIGHVSYATYMIHYFVRDIFKFSLVRVGEEPSLYVVVAALIVVLGASVPLYFLIERPAQRFITALVKRIVPVVDTAPQFSVRKDAF